MSYGNQPSDGQITPSWGSWLRALGMGGADGGRWGGVRISGGIGQAKGLSHGASLAFGCYDRGFIFGGGAGR